MNFSGCLRCFGSLADGPRTYFRLSGGQIGNQSEQTVSLPNDSVQTGFLQSHFRQEQFFFLVLQVGDFCFDFCTDWQHRSVFLCCNFADRLIMRMGSQISGKVLFTEIGSIDDRLCREQRCFFQPFLFFLCHLVGSGRLAFFEVCFQLFQKVQLAL